MTDHNTSDLSQASRIAAAIKALPADHTRADAKAAIDALKIVNKHGRPIAALTAYEHICNTNKYGLRNIYKPAGNGLPAGGRKYLAKVEAANANVAAAAPAGIEKSDDRSGAIKETPVVTFSASDFHHIVRALGELGANDIADSEALKPPVNAEEFAIAVIFVICNSGMKNSVAIGIDERVKASIRDTGSAVGAFRHSGKVAAIDSVWRNRDRCYREFMEIESDADRIAFLEKLPWIGRITKFHIAKSLGVDVAKPDVHLQRLADHAGTTPQLLCETIAREVGLRTVTVDTILWRACERGVIDSKNGVIARAVAATFGLARPSRPS